MTAVPTPTTGRELSNPSSDGITNLRFSNTSDRLLVLSWDKSVRWYDATAKVLKGDFRHGGAVLDCCVHDESSGFIACLDNYVWRKAFFIFSLVFNYSKEDILGRHDAPVRSMEYSYATGQVITGSWDKTLKCWDPRGASGQEHTPIGTYAQPERVYSLSQVMLSVRWKVGLQWNILIYLRLAKLKNMHSNVTKNQKLVGTLSTL